MSIPANRGIESTMAVVIYRELNVILTGLGKFAANFGMVPPQKRVNIPLCGRHRARILIEAPRGDLLQGDFFCTNNFSWSLI